MRSEFDSELEERLVRYCRVDTQSDQDSATTPSTDVQWDLARMLEKELQDIGASDIKLTEYGAVLATIPATTQDAPVIGLLAHMDTAPAFAAAGVKPIVHRNYNGGSISYPDNPDLHLSPEFSPYLGEKTGDDIITASGTTLLGADDKSGVAIIMTAARHLIENPDIPHGELRLAFTPDEEIGRGVHDNLPRDLAVDFAYTFDAGQPGVVNHETFSADGATVTFTGVSVHPGTAKGKLVNATHLAAQFIAMLPKTTLTPETTDGHEGFMFVSDFTGTAAECQVRLILRDYELDGLEEKRSLIQQIADVVQATEPRAVVNCEFSKQYRNMRYWLDDFMMPVELAYDAYRAVGLEPRSEPVRGGTDGSLLTEMGVPTPNLFTGQQDLHGPYEWISVQDMALATKVALRLVQLAVNAD